jgi:hypothetical protein
MRILILILISISGFCQVPEIPKFKSVKVESFGGAPVRYQPIITTNILFWIPPNAEIIATDLVDGFVKVNYEKSVGYVFADNFKKNPEVQQQLDLISKAEQDRLDYYEKMKEFEIRYKDSVKLAEGINVMVRREEESFNKTKKNIAKYKSLGSPLAFVEANVSYNSIGIPEANLSALNINNNNIDAFEVSILCYDNYNRPVNHYLYRTNAFKGISQEIIEPNNETFGTWTLYGYENTTKVSIVLKSVHYKGKGAWFPKNRILIKSE